MVNLDKLRGKIAENRLTVESFSEKSNIEKSTLYRRFANEGKDFTIEEVEKIAFTLSLTISEINCIFFAEIVA